MNVATVPLTIIMFVHWGEALYEEPPKSQKELVDYLRSEGIIKSKEVSDVMCKVDRAHYVAENSYEDIEVSIGHNVSINAPYMHALALEELKGHLKTGNKSLDVGSGSGYLTACMALMMGETGHVVGVELRAPLVDYARKNVMKDNNELLTSGRVKFILGDGRLGVPEEGPFDVIHVGASASKIPKGLIQQLKIGGRMVIPLGDRDFPSKSMVVDKLRNGSVAMYPIPRGKVLYSRLKDPKEPRRFNVFWSDEHRT